MKNEIFVNIDAEGAPINLMLSDNLKSAMAFVADNEASYATFRGWGKEQFIIEYRNWNRIQFWRGGNLVWDKTYAELLQLGLPFEA